MSTNQLALLLERTRPDLSPAERAELISSTPDAPRKPADGHSRRRGIYPPRRPQRPPQRAVAIERRRRLAYSGPMPAQLAAQFTLGELSCLRIVADEIRERGFCALTLAAIAARAGCCRELARRTLRKAEREGLLTIEERRRPGQVNLANVVRIVSKEWLAWIARGPKTSADRGTLSKAQARAFDQGIGPTDVGRTDRRLEKKALRRAEKAESEPRTRHDLGWGPCLSG